MCFQFEDGNCVPEMLHKYTMNILLRVYSLIASLRFFSDLPLNQDMQIHLQKYTQKKSSAGLLYSPKSHTVATLTTCQEYLKHKLVSR